jgi:transcription initiation factor TFIIE subunit beta
LTQLHHTDCSGDLYKPTLGTKPPELVQELHLTMSYFSQQIKSFHSDVKSTSNKLQKKTVAASHAPSPAPSAASSATANSKPDVKRKREELPANQVWSQPADTGMGQDYRTNVQYAIEHLKSKDRPLTLTEILNYLSFKGDESKRRGMAGILKQHPRVRFVPDMAHLNAWGAGTYEFRPLYDISDATQLVTYLQNQKEFKGLLVKDLKDGWANIEDSIDDMEGSHQILVTRNKKDNHAKSVYPDEPSLFNLIDDEYQLAWHKIHIPPPAELPGELTRLGLKPTSVDPTTIVKKVATKEKVNKKPRRGGRTTNIHMAGILKDYSGTKR